MFSLTSAAQGTCPEREGCSDVHRNWHASVTKVAILASLGCPEILSDGLGDVPTYKSYIDLINRIFSPYQPDVSN